MLAIRSLSTASESKLCAYPKAEEVFLQPDVAYVDEESFEDLVLSDFLIVQ